MLRKLAESEGCPTVGALLDKYGLEASVVGICTTCGEYIDDQCEPDMEDGLCEECETPTVKSCLILAGVI